MIKIPVEPGKVFSRFEFVILGSNGNCFKYFCAPTFWFTVFTKEKVCEPVFAERDSNSSKSKIGINDLDLYKRICFLLFNTSTKYEPSSKPGITVPCAVYDISSPVKNLTLSLNAIILYFSVLGL